MTVEEFYEKRYGKKPPVIFGVYEVSFTPKEACRFAEAYHKAQLEKEKNECKHNWHHIDNHSDRRICIKCDKEI